MVLIFSMIFRSPYIAFIYIYLFCFVLSHISVSSFFYTFICVWLLVVLHSLLLCSICRFVAFVYQWRLYWSAATVKHLMCVSALIRRKFQTFCALFFKSFVLLGIKSTGARTEKTEDWAYCGVNILEVS